jgi:hypothetical protein
MKLMNMIQLVRRRARLFFTVACVIVVSTLVVNVLVHHPRSTAVTSGSPNTRIDSEAADSKSSRRQLETYDADHPIADEHKVVFLPSTNEKKQKKLSQMEQNALDGSGG